MVYYYIIISLFIIIYHYLNNDSHRQNKIMELIPEIRKWILFNGIKAVGKDLVVYY
jgi:hypothetical protein